ncbi:MAG: RNA methyltransferase [Patescibacteria group bacterium]
MKRGIVAVLHNLRSRENVGSIFRTADGAGVSKLYLCGTTPCPPHEKISKTALGAEDSVAWEYKKQTWKVIEQLKEEGYEIVALEKTKNAENIFSFKTSNRVALVVGNEVDGISSSILKRCKKVMAIPMYGRKESLNVSVAFGIATYCLRKA